MSTPITITLTAETLQAVRNLQAFAENVQASFKKTEVAAVTAGTRANEFAVDVSKGMARAAEGVARLQKAYADLATKGEMVVQANRNIQRSAEAVGRIQAVTGAAGVNPAALGGRGVGNWFAAGQIGEAGKRFEELGRKVGNTRIAYMQLGSIVPNVSSSIIAGISPMRALAVQIPDLVQALGFMGVKVAVMGTAFAALIPWIVTGTFAWRAHAAAVQEAASKNELLAQTQKLITRNQELVTSALKKGMIGKDDAEYIEALLKLGTGSGLKEAQKEMQRLSISPDQVAAAEKFKEILDSSRDAGMGSGIEAEQTRVLNTYQEKMRQIADLVKQNPALKGQQGDAESAAAAERDARLAALRIQENKELEAKTLKRLEGDLADFRRENSDNQIGNAQKQFEIESSLYGELFRQQIISKERYDELWNEGNRKRIAGIDAETEAAKKLEQQWIDSYQQIAQAKLSGRIQGVESDPLLSQTEKARQLLPLLEQQRSLTQQLIELNERRVSDAGLSPEAQIEAQRQLVALHQQDVDLMREEQALRGQDSMAFQFGTALVDLQDQWGSWAQQLATNFADVFNAAISTISNGITGLIMGTMTWGQALQQIGNTILTSVVQSIVQMGVRWIATKILMATVGKAIEAAALGAAAAMAAGYAAIWAVPASLATIATFGAAAAAAPGLIAMSNALTLATSLPAFAEGGRPPVGKVSVVGEEGPELFVADTAGTIIPARESARIMESGGGSSAGTGSSSAVNVKTIVVANIREAAIEAMNSEAGERVIVQHINGRRIDLGLET